MEGEVEEYYIYLWHIDSYVKSKKGIFGNMTLITNDLFLADEQYVELLA